MKTDDDSGEAEEPPEKPPCSGWRTKKIESEENEELQWARRNVPEDRARRTKLTIDRIDRRTSSPGKERES